MPVTIEIPTAFRRFTGGAPKVDCSATTIAEALNELTTRFPALSRHVRDESGQIRQFLNVYLNEEDIRFLGGESCSLKEGDRVLLVPSIAGGSTCQDWVQRGTPAATVTAAPNATYDFRVLVPAGTAVARASSSRCF